MATATLELVNVRKLVKGDVVVICGIPHTVTAKPQIATGTTFLKARPFDKKRASTYKFPTHSKVQIFPEPKTKKAAEKQLSSFTIRTAYEW